MRRYLLDTGIAGDLVFRRGPAVERARQARMAGGRLGLATPVLAELLFGAENSPSPVENRQGVLRAVAKWMLWPFDREAAERYGALAAELKRTGRPMQQFDIAIAAIAESRRLHRDLKGQRLARDTGADGGGLVATRLAGRLAAMRYESNR